MDERTVNILLVEDSEHHAEMIGEALTAAAYGVNLTVVRSLAAARASVSASPPDLAIVDLMLPDGNGTELLSLESEDAGFPVVIVTGQGNEQAAVEAIKAGALDYVVKSAWMLADMPRIIARALREWEHIRDRTQTQAALRQKRKKYQDLVETVNDWVWEIDSRGVYTYASPNVRDLLGYAPEEVIGKTPFELMPLAEAERVAEVFQDIAKRQVPFRAMENTNRHKNGHQVVLETSGVPFFGEDGAFLGYRGVDRDITERKLFQEKLKEANRQLAAFAHTVSHDLRIPLTAIIGFAELLWEQYREVLDHRGQEMLGAIHRQGERMLALMEDLLALAKVGHLERPAEAVKTGEVVRAVLEELASRSADAGLRVQSGELPSVHVPQTLLSQVFENLIGNALHYAGRDGGPIEIGGEQRGERIRFHVRDHGPGIPEKERRHVFEAFYRGSTGKQVLGTGIGLAIVQKIARLYDGRAWVEETPGGGSTFWVELADTPASARRHR
jgi:PAS domain S-box-containing protein